MPAGPPTHCQRLRIITLALYASDWGVKHCNVSIGKAAIGKVAWRVSPKVSFFYRCVSGSSYRGVDRSMKTAALIDRQGVGRGQNTVLRSVLKSFSLVALDIGLTKTEHGAPEETRRRQCDKKRLQGWANNAFRDGLTTRSGMG